MSDDDEVFGSLLDGWEESINMGSDEERTAGGGNIRWVPPASPPNQMNTCECNICMMIRYNNKKSGVDYTHPIQSIKECGTVERMETIEINCPLVYKLIMDFLKDEGMPGGVSKFDPKYDNNQKKEEGSEEADGSNGEDINDIIGTPYDHNNIPSNIICITHGNMGCHLTPLGTGNIYLWRLFGQCLEEFVKVMEQSPKCKQKDSAVRGKVTQQKFNTKKSGLKGKPHNVNFSTLRYERVKWMHVPGKTKRQCKTVYFRSIPRGVGMNNVDYFDYANQVAGCINNCDIPPEEMKARNGEIDNILSNAELLVPRGGLPPSEEEVYAKLDAVVEVSTYPILCTFHLIILR